MEKETQSPRLNRWLVTAGSLMTLTTCLHVFGGGPEVYDPVRASDLAPEVRSVLSVIWHAITAILAIMAIGLFWVSRHRNLPLEVAFCTIQISFAALFVGYGRFDLGNLTVMPQWVIFGVGAVLILLADRPGRQRSGVAG